MNKIDIKDIKLEELEKRYFDFMTTALRGDLNCVINGLNSRLEILDDWKSAFLATARKGHSHPSDLDAGAERVFHHFFKKIFEFPNTSPIGSDLMYKTEEAIIHIEIKTTLKTNLDYKGKIQLGRNQISYKSKKFKPNLPTYYSMVNLPTLTYAIQIVHEHFKPKINSISLISIPNGSLIKYYGEDILAAGKGGWGKATDVRYKYAKEPYFKLLNKKYNSTDNFRIEILALSKNFSVKDLTGTNLRLHPFKII